MNALVPTLLCGSLLVLAACSGEHTGEYRSEENPEHQWKVQAETLQKARDLERVLQEAADEERRALERQIQ